MALPPEKVSFERFDHYNQKVSDAARATVAAVVLLNSGAWLALMSQLASLATLEPSPKLGTTFVIWSGGVSLGVGAWLVLFLIAYLIAAQFRMQDPNVVDGVIRALTAIGVIMCAASIVCFFSGAVILSQAFM